MIQELFGGGNVPSTGILGERKVSIPFSCHSSTSACPSTTPVLTTTIASTPSSTNTVNSSSNSPNGGTNNSSSEPSGQNLRCPRCDSTNTKFCYYNNYNLTQPRHFCKTCRRYWTKGGTLRNVPIGGGCRKNKSTIVSSSSTTSGMCKSSPNAMAKAKATLSSEMLVNENSLFLGNGMLDHQFQQPGSNSILWPSLPNGQNSHILALLRGANHFPSNPNPNPNPSSSPISSMFTNLKTEGSMGSDSYGNGAPSALGSFSRSNHNQLNGFASGSPEYAQNNGNGSSNILDLYQRLKSTSNYGYCGNENPGVVILGNMVGSTSSSSAMNSTALDATSMGGGENWGGYSFMSSPAISSWSDYSSVPINGAFP